MNLVVLPAVFSMSSAGPVGDFLLHPNIFSENMLLVDMEKLQGVRSRKEMHLPIGNRPFYFRSIDAM